MADFKLKPGAGTGNKLILESQDGTDVLTTSDSGVTLASATLNSPTLVTPALGTVTSGNLSNNNIVMPRIKEYDKYYYPTTTTTSTSNDDAVNISGSNSVALTPEHTGDLFEFSWRFCMSSNGYSGHGVQRATNNAFTSGVATQWSTGRHTWGNFSGASLDFVDSAGSITVDATGLSAGTTYYFRLIGMTHSTTASHTFGSDATNSTNGIGIHFSAKRWSIV